MLYNRKIRENTNSVNWAMASKPRRNVYKSGCFVKKCDSSRFLGGIKINPVATSICKGIDLK